MDSGIVIEVVDCHKQLTDVNECSEIRYLLL